MGAVSERQFVEKQLPTLDEINEEPHAAMSVGVQSTIDRLA